MLCYVTLCYLLCYVMLCWVMLCYVMLCYVMLCYVMLCKAKQRDHPVYKSSPHCGESISNSTGVQSNSNPVKNY